MRGTRVQLIEWAPQGGIIPADAGNTRHPLRGLRHGQDHPRGCGEHLIGQYGPIARLGSSPRMRGTQTSSTRNWLAYRIIPADAGKLLSCTLSIRCSRIIPADAGNTNCQQPGATGNPDHPRGCGEHVLASHRSSAVVGSSPRMRGTRRARAALHVRRGIIPADAGSTITDVSVTAHT